MVFVLGYIPNITENQILVDPCSVFTGVMV